MPQIAPVGGLIFLMLALVKSSITVTGQNGKDLKGFKFKSRALRTGVTVVCHCH